MTYRFVSLKRAADNESDILTLRARPSWPARLFGSREHEVKFVGYCTVWHRLPEFHRCSTGMKSMLADFWKGHTYWSSAGSKPLRP